MRPAWSLLVVTALAGALLVAACGAPTTARPEAETEDAAISTSPPIGQTAEAPLAAPTEDPPQEPGGGDIVDRATITIGDNTWSFDRVEFCAISIQEDETVSFVMISHHDGVQLVAKINDPTGERRLEGEGVWGYIELQDNNPVIVEGYEVIRMWSAGSQASGEQFIVVDGLSVTASADFDDVMATTEIEQIPGTLQATCP